MSEQLNINAKGTEILEEIEELESIVEMNKKLSRLKLNPDFQDVIVDGYIGTLSKQLFLDLTRPLIISGIPHDEVYAKLDAIRHLKYELGLDEDTGIIGVIEHNSIRAQDRIDDLRQEIGKING